MSHGKVYLSEPMAHQLEVLRHPARNKVVVCGRRWGKTRTGQLACVEGHGPRHGGLRGALDGANVWWVAPTFPIASMIWRDLKRSLRDGWGEKNENERRIVMPGGGSITVKSADNPDSLRGDGLDGCVLDEAAFMKQDAWAACIRPALSDKRGWAMFLTTPCGMNWFQRLWQDVPNRRGWERWQRPTSDNPLVLAEELAAARREVGPYLFAQEYEAQFLSAGGGLFKEPWCQHRYDWIGASHLELEGGQVVELEQLRRVAAADLAVSVKSTADYTAIVTLGVAPDRRMLLLDVERRRCEGPDIVPLMRRVLDRWRAPVLWVERVGFQLALLQQARREGLPVREAPADRDKVSRSMPVTAALEGGQLLLPASAPWLEDFMTELLSFPNAAHDDQVDALAYAVAVRHVGMPDDLAAVGEDDDDDWRPTERDLLFASYCPNPPPGWEQHESYELRRARRWLARRGGW